MIQIRDLAACLLVAICVANTTFAEKTLYFSTSQGDAFEFNLELEEPDLLVDGAAGSIRGVIVQNNRIIFSDQTSNSLRVKTVGADDVSTYAAGIDGDLYSYDGSIFVRDGNSLRRIEAVNGQISESEEIPFEHQHLHFQSGFIFGTDGYGSQGNVVRKYNLSNGSVSNLIVDGSYRISGLTGDPVSSKIFVGTEGENGERALISMNEDGSDQRVLLDRRTNGEFYGAEGAIYADGKIFWRNWPGIASFDLARGEMTIVVEVTTVHQIAYDAINERLYWGGSGPVIHYRSLHGANIDGTDLRLEAQVQNDSVEHIKKNPFSNHLYYNDPAKHEFYIIDLDSRERVLLSAAGGEPPYGHVIQNFEPLSPTSLLITAYTPRINSPYLYLADVQVPMNLEPVNNFSDYVGYEEFKFLDRSEVATIPSFVTYRRGFLRGYYPAESGEVEGQLFLGKDLLEIGGGGRTHIQIDDARGLIYWSDYDGIHRTTRQGLERETLVPEVYGTFALDYENGDIYFPSYDRDRREHLVSRYSPAANTVEAVFPVPAPVRHLSLAIDSDNDGTDDVVDLCPENPEKALTNACGCSIPDTDSDGDGTPDCNESCPADSLKVEAGACGCGVEEVDTNQNSIADCLITTEAYFYLQELRNSIRQLKHSSVLRGKKKKLQPQQEVRATARKSLSELNAILKSVDKKQLFNVSGKRLKELLKNFRVSTKAAIKGPNAGSRESKKQAIKAIRKLTKGMRKPGSQELKILPAF